MTEEPPRPSLGTVPRPSPGDRPRPSPGGVPGSVPDATGRVLGALDAALRPLDTLVDRPVDEHPAVFDAVHESLRRTLTESDS